jgi:molecular chaperone GrpE (heat shock protein)
MAFFDFFWKRAKHLADSSVQNTILGINSPLTEINYRLAEQNDRLRRIESKQKETGIQLDGIDDFLQNNGSNIILIEALIALIDIIGDFYYFAASDDTSPLFEQAQMMMNTAIKTMETAGLGIISAANEPFDFRLHTAESTEQDNDLPNGYIINTLKYGYIYNDEVIRRAAVVVNKIMKNDEPINNININYDEEDDL